MLNQVTYASLHAVMLAPDNVDAQCIAQPLQAAYVTVFLTAPTQGKSDEP